jgi:hypothetical protein
MQDRGAQVVDQLYGEHHRVRRLRGTLFLLLTSGSLIFSGRCCGVFAGGVIVAVGLCSGCGLGGRDCQTWLVAFGL